MTRWTLGCLFAAAFAGACVGGAVYVLGDRAWHRLRDDLELRILNWWSENA